MVTTQIALRKNADATAQLIRKSDGLTLSYSAGNVTSILSGITEPVFVLQKVGYPFTYQARDQTEFTTANFDTAFDLLLSNPDRAFKLD